MPPGGATEWTLAAAPGGWNGTFPGTATWYVGPLTSNPLASRITAAGLSSAAMSYGVGSSENCCVDWGGNTLFGVSQVGSSLTLYSFSDSSGKDHNEPQEQITYNLVQ